MTIYTNKKAAENTAMFSTASKSESHKNTLFNLSYKIKTFYRFFLLSSRLKNAACCAINSLYEFQERG